VYDTTATWAADQLSSGLHSFLTSPVDRWFSIMPGGAKHSQLSHQARLWLDDVADIMYDEYGRVTAGFNQAMHEAYLEISVFGTCIVFQDWNEDENCLLFRTFALADCAVLENAHGQIDTVYRRCLMTARMIEQEFGSVPPQLAKLTAGDQLKEFVIVHVVRPRADRIPDRMDGPNKRYLSLYWARDTREALAPPSGYDSQCYHVARWSKMPGEIYGRSPGWNCLPDIQMVNAMAKTIIVAAQKRTDPPLVVPNDGFALPIRTHPGSLIFKDAGAEKIEALDFKGQIDLGDHVLGEYRQAINQAFYIDWLSREKKKERQSVLEIQDDRTQMLQMMAPIIGRLQVEMLAPMLSRSYEILSKRRRLPDPPADLFALARKRGLTINYLSPAAKAQLGSKAAAVTAFIQDVTQLSQQFPEILDRIDPDLFSEEMALLRDVPERILRPMSAMVKIRQQKAAQQQAAQDAQNAKNMGQGMGGAGQGLNGAAQGLLQLAQARAAGGGSTPGIPGLS
jgi:hypothetical protein